MVGANGPAAVGANGSAVVGANGAAQLVGLLILALIWGVPIYLTNVLGKRKGRELAWLWGLLSWIGVAVVMLLPAKPAS